MTTYLLSHSRGNRAICASHLKQLFRQFIIFYSFLLATFTFIPNAFAADYEFSSIEHLIEQELSAEVLTKIYKQIGKDIAIKPLRAEQAELEATAGIKDGEVARIFGYGNQHPSVIRIPTSYYQLETMAFFKKDSNVSLRTINDLKKYRVAYIKGVKHTDALIKKLGNNIRNTNSTTEMMELVQIDRADIAITSKVDGKSIIKRLGFTNLSFWKIPDSQLNLYHYVHSSNADLVGPINNTIKKMRASGELQKIIDNAERRLVDER